jgi:hypothetical protein
MTTVVIVDTAEEQLRESCEWWMTHREANPSLVMDEYERCVSLLESSPDIGARFHRSRVPGVRRLLMKRTKHHVYSLHDEPNAIVYTSRSGAHRRSAIQCYSIHAKEPTRDTALRRALASIAGAKRSRGTRADPG